MKAPLVVCIAILLGFALGRMTNPKSVKAAGGLPQIHKIHISGDSSYLSGVIGDVSAMSCVSGGDCYVLTN